MGGMDKINVVIADSSPAFRAGLRRSFTDESDINVAGEAVDGEEAVKLAAQLQPHVVLIDVKIPGLQGIESAKQIRTVSPKTAVLILSDFHQESEITDGLHAGASGYLLKTAPLSAIISSIRVVSAGNFVFDTQATARILHKLNTHDNNGDTIQMLANRETGGQVYRNRPFQ